MGWRIAAALFGTALMLGALAPARADDGRSMKTFLADCHDSDVSHSQYCLAYTVGVWDAISLVSQLRKEQWVCADDLKNVTPGQLLALIEKWGAKNADKLDTDMNVAVYTAIMEGFPCKG